MPFNTYTDIHNEDHSGLFEGDLVISTPGIRFFELGSLGTDEFILIACDGLWDAIGPEDAVTEVTTSSLPWSQRKCSSPGKGLYIYNRCTTKGAESEEMVNHLASPFFEEKRQHKMGEAMTRSLFNYFKKLATR